jgi:hypothetical protein
MLASLMASSIRPKAERMPKIVSGYNIRITQGHNVKGSASTMMLRFTDPVAAMGVAYGMQKCVSDVLIEYLESGKVVMTWDLRRPLPINVVTNGASYATEQE